MEDLFKEHKRCLNDLILIKGRSDKKFCGPKCKSAFNNAIYRERHKVFYGVDKTLHKNYTILKMFYEKSRGEIFIPIKELYQQGFNPHIFTGIMISKNAEEKLYILYDYGYVRDRDQSIKILFKDGGFHNCKSQQP